MTISFLQILPNLLSFLNNSFLNNSDFEIATKNFLDEALSKIYNVTQIYLNNAINSSTKEDFLDLFYF